MQPWQLVLIGVAGWMNRKQQQVIEYLLEENRVPAFWVANKVSHIDPAFLRRFDYVMELRNPPISIRRRILETSLSGLQLPAGWLERQAHEEKLTPAFTDRAAKVLGAQIIFRATPAAQSPLRPASDYQFWRTERVHVEWTADGPLDRREGRLLGRDGRALAVPVTLTERDQNGRPVVAADVSLASLAPGDYVLEIFAVRGADETRRHVPIRVVR